MTKVISVRDRSGRVAARHAARSDGRCDHCGERRERYHVPLTKFRLCAICLRDGLRAAIYPVKIRGGRRFM